jgi:site-specific recombinase XerD
MKLSEVYKLYEADKKIIGFSPYTFKAYKIQMDLMIRHFGDTDIESLSLADLKIYLAKDADRLKPSSIGHRIRFIRSIFRYAHEEGYISTFTAAKIKEPKEGKRIPKFIVEEDIERLRDAATGAREKALICLLYATGCRVGEVHRMNRSDINWENRSIVVLGKGDKQREVYFDTKTYLWLKEYLATREDDCESLFVSERKVQGEYRRSEIHQLRYTVKRVAKRSKVDVNVYPHRFRHSFATHLMDRGAPLEVISDLCGHEKVETTKIYAALSGDRRREQYRKYF